MGEESPSYQKGSITLIPANFPHGIQSAPGRVCFWEFLYVDIMGFAKNCGDEDACAKGKLLQNLINIPLLIEAGEYPRLSGLVLAILEENREKRFRNREAVNGYLYVLLQEMIRMDENMFRSQGSNMLHVEKIRPALVYVELHYSKEIKIKELARACSVSEPYFRRLFTECMNMAPLEYINMVRVQKACDFLKKEDLSMNALAWKVGFSSVSTLERNFKKIVGASPKQWKASLSVIVQGRCGDGRRQVCRPIAAREGRRIENGAGAARGMEKLFRQKGMPPRASVRAY